MARFTQGGGSSNNGGAALNYVQVVGTQQTVSSAPTSVINLDITTTGKPVQISVTGEGANASAGSWLRLNLFRGNTEIGNAIQLESSGASENVPFAINFIDDVAAGAYNYSVRVTTINGGSWTFGEAAGPVINAVELTGFKGDRGLRGLTGDQGPQGEPGADGLIGEDGANGLSAFEVAAANGFPGTEEEWLEFLRGLSAYDIAIENGFEGTEEEWLDSLSGSGGTADTGNFIFDNNVVYTDNGDDTVFRSLDSDEETKGQLRFEPSNGRAVLSVYSDPDDTYYSNDAWASAEWTVDGSSNPIVVITNTPDIFSFLDNNYTGTNKYFVINGTDRFDYEGSNRDYGTYSLTIGVSSAPSTQPTTITSIQFYQSFESKIDMDYDDNELLIRGTDMEIIIESTSDITINSGDDLDLEAEDDIRFYTNTDSDDDYQWIMDSEGRFQLPGDGYIENPENSSGDGNGNDTLRLVPDSDLEDNDQYIIIDPTAPNHIHIRAGGEQDNSGAELILGAERTNVRVSDSGYVSINTKRFSVVNSYQNFNDASTIAFVTNDINADIDYEYLVNVDGTDYEVSDIQLDTPFEGSKTIQASGAVFTAGQNYTFSYEGGENYWNFNNSGDIAIPGGIYNESEHNNLLIESASSVILSGYNGEFLNDETIPDNQIATIGNIEQAILPFEIDSSDVEFATLTSPNRSVRLQTTSSSADIRIDSSDRLDITSVDRARLLSDSYIELQAGEEVSVRSLGSHVVLSGNTGEFLNTIEPANQIATIGDISNATPVETSFTVNGGSLGTMPTFDGDPLFTGSYVKTGPLVHFMIDVDFDNITSFGTGQYYVDLPLPSKYNYHFRDACLHDNSGTVRQYALSGHVYAGQSRVTLWFTSTSGQDELFDYNSPALLTVQDNFHISGTYISQ